MFNEDGTEGSETPVIRTQTPGNYPKETYYIKKKWYLHLPEWYRLSLRVRRRLPRLLALVPGLEDPPEGPVDGSPALLRTARTDTQSVLLHNNSTQTDRESHASHMLGSPHTFSLHRNPTYTNKRS